jgi:hypothetical protein
MVWQTPMSVSLAAKLGIARAREGAQAVRLQLVRLSNASTERSAMPIVSAIARPVQWVALCRG